MIIFPPDRAENGRTINLLRIQRIPHRAPPRDPQPGRAPSARPVNAGIPAFCTRSAESGRGGTPPLPHHEACRLLALRGFRSLAPFVQRVLGFSSRRIRFGTLRPYLGTPLRRLLSPSFHGLPLCFSCPSSVRSKSLNGLRIQPFTTLRQLLWPLLTSPRPSPVIADELVLSPRRRDLLE